MVRVMPPSVWKKVIRDLLLVLAGGQDGVGLLVRQGGINDDHFLGVLSGDAHHGERSRAEDHGDNEAKDNHPFARANLALELSNLEGELGLNHERLGESAVGIHLPCFFPFGYLKPAKMQGVTVLLSPM